MKISCVLILAAAAAMMDVGHCGEYPYEYTTYDNAGWSEPNSVVATRRQQQQYQSPNPTLTRRQQQALGALFNPGTAVAGAGAALNLAVTSVVNQQLNQRVDDTNSRVGTVENDVKKSKANIVTLTADSCTKTTCADIKTTADAACPLTKCNAIETTATDACPKTKCTEICNKVNEIVGVTPVGTADATLLAVKSFTLTNILLDNEADASSTEIEINGKKLAAGTDDKKLAKTDAEVMADTVGVTAQDFDDFRAKVADADSKLQAKIDEILQDIADLSCA